MLPSALGKTFTWIGTITASPAAFLIVIAYGVVWIVVDPDTLDMHGIVTLIVWAMTLFIQRAEHRDTQALHAKIDELLKADQRARNDLVGIDEREPEEIEERRNSEA